MAIKKLLENINFQSWVFISLLVLLSYGTIWTRGGYGDDFVLLANSVRSDLLETSETWGNSRYASNVSNWAMVNLLNNPDVPGGFSWISLHLISVLSLFIAGVFLDWSLSIFRLNRSVRWMALLIFYLHPIKDQAVLWSCAVLIYNTPLAVFLGASYFYLRNGVSNDRKSNIVIPICVLLWIFSILSLEQFFPLLFVVITVRLIFLPRTRNSLLLGGGILIFISTVFLLTILSGKTASRIKKFGLSDDDRISHMIDTSMTIVKSYIIYPLQSALDPLFWHQFFTPLTGLVLVLGLIVIGRLVFNIFNKGELDFCDKPATAMLFTACAGLFFLIAPLSPFFLTKYYLPERAFYVPLFGLAISISALSVYLFKFLKSAWMRHVFLIGATLTLWLFFIANIFTQNEFSNYWAVERSLITTLVESDLKQDSSIYIFGAPKTNLSAPSLIDEYTVTGLVRWVFPNKHITASSIKDIGDIFNLPDSRENISATASKPPRGDVLNLLWANDRWNPLGEISINTGHQAAEHSWQPYFADGSCDSSAVSSVQPVSAFSSKELDTLILCVKVPALAAQQSLRLFIHASYHGVKLPYDETISATDGPLESHRHCSVLRKFADIHEILVGSDFNAKQGAGGNNAIQLKFVPELPVKLLTRR